MKKILVMLLTLLLTQIQTLAVLIPENTVITAKPEKLIDADDVKEGDTVYFRTIYPVKINEQVAIKTGTEITAKVIRKKNNCILGIPGKIEIGTFELHTPQNDIIPLSGTIEDKGDGRYWAHIGWFFLFPLLFIKGDDGKISASHSINLYVLEAGKY